MAEEEDILNEDEADDFGKKGVEVGGDVDLDPLDDAESLESLAEEEDEEEDDMGYEDEEE